MHTFTLVLPSTDNSRAFLHKDEGEELPNKAALQENTQKYM